MNVVHAGGCSMVSVRGKILDLRLPESLQNKLSRTFCSTKLSLESWVLHYLHENFPEYPSEITIGISIIIYKFLWFKNYKLYWFSNSFLDLLFLVPKQFVLYLKRIYCSWQRWLLRAMHTTNFVTSSQNFNIAGLESVIRR